MGRPVTLSELVETHSKWAYQLNYDPDHEPHWSLYVWTDKDDDTSCFINRGNVLREVFEQSIREIRDDQKGT